MSSDLDMLSLRSCRGQQAVKILIGHLAQGWENLFLVVIEAMDVVEKKTAVSLLRIHHLPSTTLGLDSHY